MLFTSMSVRRRFLNISHARIELENKLKKASRRLAETTEEEIGEG